MRENDIGAQILGAAINVHGGITRRMNGLQEENLPEGGGILNGEYKTSALQRISA